MEQCFWLSFITEATGSLTLTETLARTQAQIKGFAERLHFVQLCFVRPFKLLFSLMTWKL